MQPSMLKAETNLFASFLRSSHNYFEFGTGGSTCLAASLVRNSVTSVDSSREWLDLVHKECDVKGLPIKPMLLHVDIGTVVEWGRPVQFSRRSAWSDYHSSVWSNPRSKEADFYLVDGRFRVACFMQILLHSQHDALIAIHDFASRAQYHVVREVAREIAIANEFSVFIKKSFLDHQRVTAILDDHAFAPD
jgi:hypothetical protein